MYMMYISMMSVNMYVCIYAVPLFEWFLSPRVPVAGRRHPKWCSVWSSLAAPPEDRCMYVCMYDTNLSNLEGKPDLSFSPQRSRGGRRAQRSH